MKHKKMVRKSDDPNADDCDENSGDEIPAGGDTSYDDVMVRGDSSYDDLETERRHTDSSDSGADCNDVITHAHNQHLVLNTSSNHRVQAAHNYDSDGGSSADEINPEHRGRDLDDGEEIDVVSPGGSVGLHHVGRPPYINLTAGEMPPGMLMMNAAGQPSMIQHRPHIGII